MDETIDEAKVATALFDGHWFDMSTARRNLLYLGAILAGCENLIKEVAREGRNIPGWSKRDHPIEMLFDDHWHSRDFSFAGGHDCDDPDA